MSCLQPLIALTPYYRIDQKEPYMRPAYLTAVQQAGGIPVFLPPSPSDAQLFSLVDRFDGFLFTGGPDVHPRFFGQETHSGCGVVCPTRDHLELRLLRAVMKAGKPVLGICRGIQVINIALGGDLFQHLTSPLAHDQPFGFHIPSHKIFPVPKTQLAQICGEQPLWVNSMHHQAIKTPGPGALISARSSDGLAEALELPGYPSFLLGVQWHPEYLWRRDRASARLFKAFVQAARPDS